MLSVLTHGFFFELGCARDVLNARGVTGSVPAVKYHAEAAKYRAEAARLREELVQLESQPQPTASVLTP